MHRPYGLCIQNVSRRRGDSMKWIKIIAGITTCKSPVNHWITVEYTSASKKK